nr:hypothetical protein [Candidatus Calescibacterium sp.]
MRYSPGVCTERFHALLGKILQGVVADMWQKERRDLPLEECSCTTWGGDLATILRRREAWEDIRSLAQYLKEEGGKRERLIGEALEHLLMVGVDVTGTRELYDLIYRWCREHDPTAHLTREGVRKYFYRIRKLLERRGKEWSDTSLS